MSSPPLPLTPSLIPLPICAFPLEGAISNDTKGSHTPTSDLEVILVGECQSIHTQLSSSTTSSTTVKTAKSSLKALSIPSKRPLEIEDEVKDVENELEIIGERSAELSLPRYSNPRDADIFHGSRYPLAEIWVPSKLSLPVWDYVAHVPHTPSEVSDWACGIKGRRGREIMGKDLCFIIHTNHKGESSLPSSYMLSLSENAVRTREMEVSL